MNTSEKDNKLPKRILVEELPIIFRHHNIDVTATYLKTIKGNES
ncbi:hypothetical protein [Aquimarina sp. RZ0]|nr:hypothetical protein [Aquimarina sp. RZ0]